MAPDNLYFQSALQLRKRKKKRKGKEKSGLQIHEKELQSYGEQPERKHGAAKTRPQGENVITVQEALVSKLEVRFSEQENTHSGINTKLQSEFSN